MKQLTNIIALLLQKRPTYYLDVISSHSGDIIKKKYTKDDILAENDNMADWFFNLGEKEIIANIYLSNGGNGKSWLKKHQFLIQLDENNPNQPQPTESKNSSIYAGLNGGDVPKLLANEILYENLKNEFDILKSKYQKEKKIVKKITKKIAKIKNKLFFSKIQINKKSFLETEAGQGLLGAIPQFLEVFVPRPTGLNASQETVEKQEVLTPQQNAFIEFIKTLKDSQILEINAMYKQFLKEKQSFEQQEQTNHVQEKEMQTDSVIN